MKMSGFFRLPSARLLTEYPLRVMLTLFMMRALVYIVFLLFGLTLFLSIGISAIPIEEGESVLARFIVLTILSTATFYMLILALLAVKIESLHLRARALAADRNDYLARASRLQSITHALPSERQYSKNVSTHLSEIEEALKRELYIEAEATELLSIIDRIINDAEELRRDSESYHRMIGKIPGMLTLDISDRLGLSKIQDVEQALNKLRSTLVANTQLA